ncbi:MAG: ribonuclease P protein component [Dehalococcoidia bacterium]|nr:ribonuclease P protein component [Dehalococcoidia bacterium]
MPDRLRNRSDFTEVMRKGRRARHPLLQLVALRTDAGTTRVGYSVSKQVGGAVVRNLVKRRLRAIVAGLPWRSGADVVIVARSGADSASYGELQAIVSENARKLRLLEDSDA